MPILFVGSRRWEVEVNRTRAHCYCWKLVLKQTTQVYYWTEWGHELKLHDGQTYSPLYGVESSAKEEVSGIEAGTKEAKGFVTASEFLGLSGDDIMRGALREAVMLEYLVDAREPWLSPIDFKQYWISGTTFNGSTWEATLEGIAYPLNEQVGEYWGPQCRVELFSSGIGKCNASLLQHAGNQPISLINIQGSDFEISNVFGPWASNKHGNGGKIFFNAGFNTGGYYTIKEYIYPGTGGVGTARIRLQQRTIRDFAVGDRITTYPGCNHSPTQCLDKFDNIENFQGEPGIPGGDATTKGRKSKS